LVERLGNSHTIGYVEESATAFGFSLGVGPR
jgi:hypothetical protein